MKLEREFFFRIVFYILLAILLFKISELFLSTNIVLAISLLIVSAVFVALAFLTILTMIKFVLKCMKTNVEKK